ncbi:MAG: response regulator [Acidobacteriota bacterium]|nr:response regulator [Acidobacteriota bacterium]MDE3108287.1 response regulator [Acidobacteriota bacterium]
MTRALLAEDNEMIRTYLELILRDEGFDVVAIGDGQAAWDEFARASHEWHVVLTDVGMPRLRGDELVRRVHAQSKVPCILMSGSEVLSDVPARAVLRKPFGRDELIAALVKVGVASAPTGK